MIVRAITQQVAALDWTAIIVQLIATVGIVLGAVIPVIIHLSRKVDKVHENSEVIREETRNRHDPDRPMRHDIDVLLERTKGLNVMQDDIGGLRSDVRQLYKNDHDIWDTLAKRWSRRDTSSFSTQGDIQE